MGSNCTEHQWSATVVGSQRQGLWAGRQLGGPGLAARYLGWDGFMLRVSMHGASALRSKAYSSQPRAANPTTVLLSGTTLLFFGFPLLVIRPCPGKGPTQKALEAFHFF